MPATVGSLKTTFVDHVNYLGAGTTSTDPSLGSLNSLTYRINCDSGSISTLYGVPLNIRNGGIIASADQGNGKTIMARLNLGASRLGSSLLMGARFYVTHNTDTTSVPDGHTFTVQPEIHFSGGGGSLILTPQTFSIETGDATGLHRYHALHAMFRSIQLNQDQIGSLGSILLYGTTASGTGPGSMQVDSFFITGGT